MYHYNYKITNTKTLEFYIGVRSCKCEISKDKYMGSSTVWTKAYIKENRDVLKKEIIAIFTTRKEARLNEAKLLKEVENDKLCVNQYFGIIPDLTGTHQTKEHIEKRKLCGARNGMYGKHHTEETKRKIAEKAKLYRHSEESKRKIGAKHRGKIVSKETKEKLSKAKRRIFRIVDTKENKEYITTYVDFVALFPDCSIASLKEAKRMGHLSRKRFRVYAATDSDICRKLGENGENLETDNPVGSAGSAEVQQTAND
jgi:hypothetical protein